MTAESVARIYEAYPRRVGRRAALLEIERALRRVRDELPGLVKSDEELAQMMLNTVCVYAELSKHKAHQFIPHPRTWFHQSRYLDNPEEWISENEKPESKQDELVRRNREAAERVLGKAPSGNGRAAVSDSDRRRTGSLGTPRRALFLEGD